MDLLYNFGIIIYRYLVLLASLFDKKISLLWTGQHNGLKVLKTHIDPEAKDRYIWVHAASLGEFEQGRPIIEKIKSEHPEYKVLLTFFSPSGYEVRKSYPLADIVCYLPMDTLRNAHRFVNLVNPQMAIFIKYEFWANYLRELHHNNIPTYVVSAIFRKEQAFFKWYGHWYRGLLRNFTTIFVQDENSKRLLEAYNIHNVQISGDTRFDRVCEIAENPKELPFLKDFAEDKKIIIAGSSWEKDEDLLISYFNKRKDIKLIIAPHIISNEHIFEICNKLQRPFMRFSELNKSTDMRKCECLVIDAIGFLSSVYRYGHIAYIGGGFGVGIHNTLEAAVYGMPVIFGPNYERFREAVELIENNAAFTIDSYSGLSNILDRLLSDDFYLKQTSENAAHYVAKNCGGTSIIMKELFK